MSEYVSLPILLVALAAALSAFIVWRFRRSAEMVKPCECGAKRVPYRVIPGTDTNIEELEMHTKGEDAVTSITHPNYCPKGGERVEILKPRYCQKGGLLQPDRFVSSPPYDALYHDVAQCDLSYGGRMQRMACGGCYKPTSLTPPKKLAVAA